ncbi:ornithine decarboxylase-like isoform X2 [Apostichopus japonicus]|uniref:ornithine decarboxylase-like isoform X2 n=1 Tax=Stichopus japonicus TaxID=307972 RepID=UPI003AB568D6
MYQRDVSLQGASEPVRAGPANGPIFTTQKRKEKKVGLKNGKQKISESSKDAFYVMDLGYLVRTVDEWKQLLPGVHPCYAVKANRDPALINLMSKMNFGFDCASKGEIQQMLELGVNPSRIVYSHPRKQPSHLRYASSVGVDLTVFDDEDELHKIKEIAPNMKLLLRLSTRGLGNLRKDVLPENFGCLKKDSAKLLAMAKKLNLKVTGVSFHVGLAIETPDIYSRALKHAKLVFSEARDLGFEMKVLDLGGGFPAATTTNFCSLGFDKVAGTIAKSLKEEFGDENNVLVFAEPGTHFSMPSAALVVNIIGKRTRNQEDSEPTESPEKDEPEIEYFINDGKFQSFVVYLALPYVKPVVKPVDQKYTDSPLKSCRVWGQTCARDDLVLENGELPEMSAGEWLYFTDMGAYSAVVGSNFNGFQLPTVHHYMSESMKERLDELVSGGAFGEINFCV